MNKFNSLYNEILNQALDTRILQNYPSTVQQLYKKYNQTYLAYYSIKKNKLYQIFHRSYIQYNNGDKEESIINNIITAITNSYNKNINKATMAIDDNNPDNIENAQLNKEDEEELKNKLKEYYLSNAVTIDCWKKLGELLKQVKNDSQVITAWRNMRNAYQELPQSLRVQIDLPDKSNVTIVDEILNQRLALNNYSEIQDKHTESQQMIETAKAFETRTLDEEDVYTVLTRSNGKPFVINYNTASGQQVIRAGKLNIINYYKPSNQPNEKEKLYTVKNPLEASARLSAYNNITYYDLQHNNYRTAKLSRVNSISVGNFESGIGITYIIKHY